MNAFIMVMAGGAIGAGLRYGVSLLFAAKDLPGYFATGFVNLLGSFVIGALFAALVVNRGEPSPLYPLMITGLLGGFTTFSAFSLEMMQFVATGRFAYALVYAFASVFLGLIACYIGYQMMVHS